MVDEVHERSVDNDILLGLAEKIIRKRQDLRIVDLQRIGAHHCSL